MQVDEAWLSPTWFIDSDDPAVVSFAADAAGDATDPTDVAVRLFYAVRDGFRYDPYNVDYAPEKFRASSVVGTPSNWCVPKSVLLTAAARSQGIPARLGFADVKNHLTTPKLAETMGTDLFIYHGYAELHLEGKWVKATPAFNLALCQRFRVKPLEFDGRHDSVFHAFDEDERRHMEYLRDRGSYADVPTAEIQQAFREAYPKFYGLGRDAAKETFA